MDRCDHEPKFVEADPGRRVACHLHYDHETYEETGTVMPLESGDGIVSTVDEDGVGSSLEAGGDHYRDD
jgi:hypothetical protein